MILKEDDITTSIIAQHKNSDSHDLIHVEPEAHYNHFGTRGVADLYLVYKRQDNDTIARIIEVKAELRNANEVIRQFKKMWEYFFVDRDPRTHRIDQAIFELAVLATEENLEHLKQYYELYNAVESKSGSRISRVNLHHPDSEKVLPLSLAVRWGKGAFREDVDLEFVENSYQVFFDELNLSRPHLRRGVSKRE